MDDQFTLQDSLTVQADQLKQWKAKLNTACYEALEAYALDSNKGKKNPYSIYRGVNLDNFVSNWKPTI